MTFRDESDIILDTFINDDNDDDDEFSDEEENPEPTNA